MFGISKLMSAVATLAESILAFSATVAEANTTLRQRLALDRLDEVPALEHEEAPPGGSRRGKRPASA